MTPASNPPPPRPFSTTVSPSPPHSRSPEFPRRSAPSITAGSFVSSELIFATYQNAGVRVFDIRDQYRPIEIAAWVPPAPARMMDHRPGRARVIQSADVFVDRNGLIYSTDYNAGLFILEYGG